MLCQIDWTQVGKAAVALVALVAVAFGAFRAVLSFRNGRRSGGNPGPPRGYQAGRTPECARRAERLDGLADDVAHLSLTNRDQWEALNGQGKLLARLDERQIAMHDDVKEIKKLVRNGGAS